MNADVRGEEARHSTSIGDRSLVYHVTVATSHLLAARVLLRSLRPLTDREIVCVGNLDRDGADSLRRLGAVYLDEAEVDLSGRFPDVPWETRHGRSAGWYKQMFLRLSMDRYLDAELVCVLDAEVFFFDGWSDGLLTDTDGAGRCFSWVPTRRKSDMDHLMYRGAARLLTGLPECAGIDDHADRDDFRRHISGVVLMSPPDLAHIWRRLEAETDLAAGIDEVLNGPELAFSEYELFGLAVEYGLLGSGEAGLVPFRIHDGLLGWYDNHDDPAFHAGRATACWSMCQGYASYPTAAGYAGFARDTAGALGRFFHPASGLEPQRAARPWRRFGRIGHGSGAG